MAYQSLYRRYRSQRFDEVLGQDHVTRALRNAVREGRVAHGYLFSGPRGTGKTSTARILAKVLNCAAPVDGEPCTTCEACVAVQEGRGVDWLQELDAASNRGVDAMRDLLGRVSMGTSGARKVYILDEVHMLTDPASNALLKTLEEPPAHVVFVLATTEPEKVLPTIRSRTQHFEFHLLGADVLADHVRHVIADAHLGLGDDAVDHVVRVGRGSARDTLSALDQVAAAGGVAVATTPVDDLVDALVGQDAAAALVAVEAAIGSGRDPRTLAAALVEELRHAFLQAMGAPAPGLTDRAAVRSAAIGDAVGPATLTRALEAVGAAVVEMRHAPDPRIPLEVALVRVARPASSTDPADLLRRIERLERQGPAGTPQAGRPEVSDPPAQPEEGPAASGRGGRPSSGPGAARARLAERDAERVAQQSPSPAPSAPAERPSLGAVKRARDGHRPGAPQPDVVQADEPTPSPPTVADPPRPTSAAEPGALPAAPLLQEAWEAGLLDALRGRAKAMLRLGRFVEHDGRVARFALPNAATRERSLDKLDDLRTTLEGHFGQPIPVELVVDESHAGSPTAPATGAAGDGRPEEEQVDLADLVDAPDAEEGGLAALQEAFPGAELLED